MAFVTWTPDALEDLEAICLYIGRSSPAAAVGFANRIFEATQQLEQFPEMGRRMPDVLHDDVRVLVLGNYLVAYAVTAEKVEVLAVHHGARRPDHFELG